MSKNCRRKSELRRLQNRFLGCFFRFGGPKSRLFDRKSTGGLPYLGLLSRVMSRPSISHQPKLLVVSRPNATENRPTSTQNRHDATFLCHFATLLRHSAHDANSRLRRIACDFLTTWNSVGGTFATAWSCKNSHFVLLVGCPEAFAHFLIPIIAAVAELARTEWRPVEICSVPWVRGSRDPGLMAEIPLG